ncbi:DUF6286 domain-containing protein [Streptomyces sp. TR06-5]|uniref:DUF6286 domain-containing protein n=1 Tax=unclassified Streptomyces TaxID=2593676 RepID=UPI00399F498D
MEKASRTAGAAADDAPPAGAGDLDQDRSEAAYTPRGDGRDERARRFWSTRRLPAAPVAAVLAAGTGLLLYDVVAVRLDRPGMRWRRFLADELAARPLDDVWVLTGAVVSAVLGLWLLLGAVTPGLRGLLPMRRERAGLRAGLERSAAALVLRDRAMAVAGVQAVRVRVGRRRVRARADCHFRDLDEVRADLDAALREGVGQLGTARRHRLKVTVRRPKR